MSGFAGIIHLDGSPVDRSLLERLTEFQKFRGPDAQDIWTGGPVGLGHTLLKTCPESESERQPLSLDGEIWIVADCRVDARFALIEKLERQGHRNVSQAPDAELILRTYTVWGANCVDHLLGDYTFAIWDGPNRRLFCARDQMGVKPFYYAHVNSRFILSNTLDCIRQHPAVPDDLNDLAIADFLLFDAIQEPSATSFRHIHRLPPAHTLTLQAESVSIRRYWALAAGELIHHGPDSDCIQQFRELMDAAVADRLRASSAGIMMSGGLDSATVAASAQRTFVGQSSARSLCAYTEVFDNLIPHDERHYARLVAEALGIPIEFQICDDCKIDERLPSRDAPLPEPVHSPWSDWGLSSLKQIAFTRRIALTGFGGDPTLSSLLTVHFRKLIEKRLFLRMLAEAKRYVFAPGRLSRLYIRTRFRRWLSPRTALPPYPEWLNPDFEKALDLRQRWKDLNSPLAPKEGVRPVAVEATFSASWPTLFEGYDAGVTRIPVEVRHPFFDLRIVRFLLGLESLPWCADKELLREVNRGVLPEAVRLRRKSPLRADPLVALLQRPESVWVDSFEPDPYLGYYVQRRLIPGVFKETDAWKAWIHLRPLSLNFWLPSRNASGIH